MSSSTIICRAKAALTMLLLSAALCADASAQQPQVLLVGATTVFTDCNIQAAWFIPDNNLPLPEDKDAYAEGNAAEASINAPPGYAGSAVAELGIAYDVDFGTYSPEQVKSWPVSITFDVSYEITAYWEQGISRANAALYTFDAAIDTIGFSTNDNGSRQINTVFGITRKANGSPLTLGDIALKREIKLSLLAQAYTAAFGTVPSSAHTRLNLNSITVDFIGDPPSSTTTTVVPEVSDVDFRGYPRSGSAPLTVQFNAYSKKPVTDWLWDFGDNQSGSEQNPQHTYAQEGIYTVSLAAYGPGGKAFALKPDYITVSPTTVKADFYAQPVKGTPPLTVQFFDASSGNITEWFWDFGDGESSSEQNPQHVYLEPGRYSVALTVTGAGMSDRKFIFEYICVARDIPIADFVAEPTSGTVPLSVQFTNTSSGEILDQIWHFGDGHYSDEPTPVHRYLHPGTYSVGLRIATPGGISDMVRESYITVLLDPSRPFSISGTVYGTTTEKVFVYLTGDEERMTRPADNGTYIFEGLGPGTYGVTLFQPGVLFDNSYREITVVDRDIVGVDFNAQAHGPSFIAALADPVKVPADNSTAVLFVAQVEHPEGPGALSGVWINLGPIGGNDRVSMYDDGTNGDEIPGDGVYAYTTTVAATVPPGPRAIFVIAEDNAGIRNFAPVDIMVMKSFRSTIRPGSTERKTIANDIDGQTLITGYALIEESPTASSRKTMQSAADKSSVLLQIFDNNNNPYFTTPVPVTSHAAELQIQNAGKGTWTYQIQNTGTQSRQYSISVTTAGTGIITGTITDAITGNAINGATVSTSSGMTTTTSEGYFMLLHPAGMISLQTAASQYLPASRSVSVAAGAASEVNMVLSPLEADNTTRRCFLSSSVFKTASGRDFLQPLRMFRDTVLTRSSCGRRCINLYYTHSPELYLIFEKDASLRRELASCIQTGIPDILRSIAAQEVTLSKKNMQRIRRVLRKTAQHAGSPLREELLRLEAMITQGGDAGLSRSR